MARGLVAGWTAVGAASLALALCAAPAGADTGLGTVNGIAYVQDQTPPTPTGNSSATVFARCPADRELVGGGVAMNYGGTGAVLHEIFPTTTEGSEGSYAQTFWNNSGSSLTGTAVAACARGAEVAYQPKAGEVGSVGARLTLTAKCRGATQVSGGGVFISTPSQEANIFWSRPVDGRDGDSKPDDGWSARVWTRAGLGGSTTAYAICTDRPKLLYKSKRVQLQVSDNNQPFVRCGEDHPALSAGVRVAGPVDNSILNAIETFDGGDDDLAPDDGGQVRIANVLEPRNAKVFVICKG